MNAILDPNPFLPGVYQYSIVLSTPQREMKLTAPTKERHDVWFSVSTFLAILAVLLIDIYRLLNTYWIIQVP